MPLGYEVFAGNRVDVTTVEEIVEKLEARHGLAQRIWEMDRGRVSAENLTWLQESGRRSLVGASRAEIKKWSRELAEARDWHTVRDGVEARRCTGPDGSETFLLCRSRDRREKERAMHERFVKHIETGLEGLARRLAAAKRPLEKSPIERQIGRLLERNARAAGRYSIPVEDAPELPSRLRLRWSAHAEWDDWARHSEGA